MKMFKCAACERDWDLDEHAFCPHCAQTKRTRLLKTETEITNDKLDRIADILEKLPKDLIAGINKISQVEEDNKVRISVIMSRELDLAPGGKVEIAIPGWKGDLEDRGWTVNHIGPIGGKDE